MNELIILGNSTYAIRNPTEGKLIILNSLKDVEDYLDHAENQQKRQTAEQAHPPHRGNTRHCCHW